MPTPPNALAHLHPPKRLVVCLDGTSSEIGRRRATNPAKVFEMLELDDPTRQVAYYGPGVGTMPSPSSRGQVEKHISLLLQLAAGAGIPANLAAAYGWLMRNWQRGDQIYLFGFSRGAYTARALAGMLHRPGLMRPGSDHLIPYAVAKYATDKTVTDTDRAGIKEFADAFCWGIPTRPLSPEPAGPDPFDVHVHSVPIRYLGLWDTVEAAGMVPRNRLRWPFTGDLPNVETIRHAVSIDEQRRPFREVLLQGGHPGATEVWFPGVHTDVGGTYASDNGLSAISLKWVVDGAAAELRLREGAYAKACTVQTPYATEPVHTNQRVWRYAGVRRRPIPDGALLHSSIRDRRQQEPSYLADLPGLDDAARWADPDWTTPVLPTRVPTQRVDQPLSPDRAAAPGAAASAPA